MKNKTDLLGSFLLRAVPLFIVVLFMSGCTALGAISCRLRGMELIDGYCQLSSNYATNQNYGNILEPAEVSVQTINGTSLGQNMFAPDQRLKFSVDKNPVGIEDGTTFTWKISDQPERDAIFCTLKRGDTRDKCNVITVNGPFVPGGKTMKLVITRQYQDFSNGGAWIINTSFGEVSYTIRDLNPVSFRISEVGVAKVYKQSELVFKSGAQLILTLEKIPQGAKVVWDFNGDGNYSDYSCDITTQSLCTSVKTQAQSSCPTAGCTISMRVLNASGGIVEEASGAYSVTNIKGSSATSRSANISLTNGRNKVSYISVSTDGVPNNTEPLILPKNMSLTFQPVLIDESFTPETVAWDFTGDGKVDDTCYAHPSDGGTIICTQAYVINGINTGKHQVRVTFDNLFTITRDYEVK